MKKWRGPADYLWRIKIKAIMEIISRFPGEPIIYLDSDTFVAKNIHDLTSDLVEGIPVMHEYEGRLCERRQKGYRSMWTEFKGKTLCGVRIDAASEVWNAGVVGIPGQKSSETIQLALDLCDEMCATDARRVYLEQFAVSLALQHLNGPIAPANQCIGHYWGNKNEWNEAISSFFLHSLLEKRTLVQDIEEMKKFDYSMLPLRSAAQSKVVKKLQRLLDNHFSPKEHLFFNLPDISE